MADEKIELPDGAWAVLRDPRRVTERQRRPVTRLQARVYGGALGAVFASAPADVATLAADDPSRKAYDEQVRAAMATEDFALLDDLNDALIGALVESWSYDAAPSADTAVDLPGDAYEALKNECGKHLGELMPSFAPNAEAGSPTAPSGG